ncbi:Sulfonamide resistance protein [Delftia tsuruhatensis]|uniref:MFS transporter n=1 Tax=Delftia tsuruhatensis TaxID=180282 RepID=UPI001E6C4C3B|nr:MFS transporter [Delftia tsuruhatensis]CAB5721968.1 Sulfonamide resistance protein [Delftia tsuruhatensis]CAC9681829.1 Sulfonamide resistance protein [Delftia tsuruhatensis]
MSCTEYGRHRAASFALLLPLLLAAQSVATDGYLPALPEIARDLGSASSSLAVFMLAFGVAQLVCGPLADRFGRRPVLLAGLACYTVAAAGCALAGSADALVAWRAVQGAAMAAILVCARAAVRDLYPVHEGPHIMARGLMGLGLVALVAPIAGAWGVQATGWRWVLVAMGVYSLALLALCWRTFSETRQVLGAASVLAPVSTGGVRQVFANPGFRAWTALAATTYGGIFCFLLLSPMVYVDLFGLSPVLYGWIPAGGSLVYILSITWCRRLLSRRGPVGTVQLGAAFSLLGACIQVTGCMLAPASPVPLLIGHAVYALGHGLHQPCGQAGAVGGLPPQLAGRAVSCSGFVIMCVAFCAGQLAAHFVDPTMRHGAWPMVLPMALAGVVLVLIAFVWLPWLYRVRAAPRVQPRS